MNPLEKLVADKWRNCAPLKKTYATEQHKVITGKTLKNYMW
jgi:hypothetical protein